MSCNNIVVMIIACTLHNILLIVSADGGDYCNEISIMISDHIRITIALLYK